MTSEAYYKRECVAEAIYLSSGGFSWALLDSPTRERWRKYAAAAIKAIEREDRAAARMPAER